MVRYSYVDNLGMPRTTDMDSFDRALYVASKHHEQGYYIESITDGHRRYLRDQVLLMCSKKGLL